METYQIKLATRAELNIVLKWLKRSYDKTDSGFWGNRRLIHQWFKEGEMYVCVDGGKVVGFLAGECNHNSILEIRPSKRKQGYGTILARDWIERAKAAGVCVLHVECSPPTSIPFWEKLGFRRSADGSVCWSILTASRSVALGGQDLSVRIRAYEQSMMYLPNGGPVIESEINCKVNSDGRIDLPERFVCFDGAWLRGIPIFEIHTADRLIFKDYADCSEARALGIERGECGTYFIDELHLSATELSSPNTEAGTSRREPATGQITSPKLAFSKLAAPFASRPRRHWNG
jgi:GNAT superfamily N-acetyltransferase